jgi:hypothetical protein
MTLSMRSRAISTIIAAAAVGGTIFAGAVPANASATACGAGACIDNGTVLLGVNPQGNLVVGNDGEGGPISDTSFGVFLLSSQYDGLRAGSPAEGWGVAAAGTDTYGIANEDQGYDNVTVDAFDFAGSSATSVVSVDDTFRVTSAFAPSADTAFLYQIDVTIENTSATDVDKVVYRRVMDWDSEPSEFEEYVTVQGSGAPEVASSDDNGFNTANPLEPTEANNLTGDFENAGPDDIGASFDFDFGALAAGASTKFTLFYGAAPTEADARGALDAVGATAYSLAKSSGEGALETGAPATFIFGFRPFEEPEVVVPPVEVAPVVVQEAAVAAPQPALAATGLDAQGSAALAALTGLMGAALVGFRVAARRRSGSQA